MAALHNNMVLVGILVTLFFTAHADDGTATFYAQYDPSACFGTNTPTGLIAAASADIWQDGAACRTRYRITCTDGTNLGTPRPCTGQSVEVEIVDFCRNCRGTFDLSQDAFAVIADTNAGKILIEYDQV
ncbi:EG45-like domain containing protein [Coffea arabica]|uniref:EG45-like domain containing protein n=1 Tax=Coffea arabica TaxID=13443 RepID=A0ABM4USE0_COFAR